MDCATLYSLRRGYKSYTATCNIVNDVKLYADDAIAESDKSFQSGTLTLGVDDLSDAIQTAFLGHTVNEGEITAKEQTPTLWDGFYGVDGIRGKKIPGNMVIRYNLPQPSDTNARATLSHLQPPVLEGTIMLDENGDWKKEKTFATEALAIAYLQGKSGVKTQCTKPVADVPTGGYTSTQSVGLTAGVGETIYYTTNGTTPSQANGTEFSTDIEITESCALKAIAIKAEMNDSEIATYEYFITI